MASYNSSVAYNSPYAYNVLNIVSQGFTNPGVGNAQAILNEKKRLKEYFNDGSQLEDSFGTQYEDPLLGVPQKFSSADLNAILTLPFQPRNGSSPSFPLPGLTLVSLSHHKDTYPVVGLGQAGVKGFTKGHSMWAGSLGFLTFAEDAFAHALKLYGQFAGRPDVEWISPSDIPPFDLTLHMMNEYNEQAVIYLRSVVLLDFSRNISISNPNLTEVYSFMCANVSNMVNAKRRLPNPIIETERATGPDVFFRAGAAKANII